MPRKRRGSRRGNVRRINPVWLAIIPILTGVAAIIGIATNLVALRDRQRSAAMRSMWGGI